MTTTVGELIERSRAHHPAFASEERHPNRVALSFLSTRQVERLRVLAAEHLKDRLSQARNIADTIANSLVGVDEDGNAYVVSTSGDGYEVVVDDDGIVTVGPTVIAIDPYSTGFPLPVDSLRIIDLYAVLADTERYVPIHVVPEVDLSYRSPTSLLFAIINGHRLVPIRAAPSNTGPSLWDQVESVTIVWVDTPARFETTGAWREQVFILPDAEVNVLEWDLAAFFAERQASFDDTFPPAIAASIAAQRDQRTAEATALSRLDAAPVKWGQARRNR